MLTVSAKTPGALRELAGRYEAYLGAHEGVSLADVAYTANAGRSACEQRLAVIAETAEEARGKLKGYLAGETVAGVVAGRAPGQRKKIAFLFTGQGSQYAGMGRQLYETQPVFREALDRCAAALKGELERPLLEVLYPAAGAASPIDETRYTQPALFALEYALAQVWKSWGIEPDVVLGHSVGEYVAACVAGVFSVEDGLKLIARRAAMMQALPAGGKMAAVACGEEQVRRALAGYEERVSIAAVNGPKEVVISGEGTAVEEILARWEREGVWGQPLRVSHAFHSPLMEPMLAGYERCADEVKYRKPRIDVISNVTGRKAEETELQTGSYWRRHVREAVRFADGMKALKHEGCEIFLEIGPAAVLTGLGGRAWTGGVWLPSLKKGATDGNGDWRQMAESLAELYVNGADIDWEAFDKGHKRRKLSLPTYPFERKRYWASEEPLAQPSAQQSRRSAAGSSAAGIARRIRRQGNPLRIASGHEDGAVSRGPPGFRSCRAPRRSVYRTRHGGGRSRLPFRLTLLPTWCCARLWCWKKTPPGPCRLSFLRRRKARALASSAARTKRHSSSTLRADCGPRRPPSRADSGWRTRRLVATSPWTRPASTIRPANSGWLWGPRFGRFSRFGGELTKPLRALPCRGNCRPGPEVTWFTRACSTAAFRW